MEIKFSKEMQDAIKALKAFRSYRIQFPVLESIKSFGVGISRITNSLDDSMKPISLIFAEIGKRFENSKKSKYLIEAGWVPYAGMDFQNIPFDATTDDLSRCMNTHIETEWEFIRDALLDTVNKSDVDQEAQETFLEAIEAFEAGLYRSVVRVLFPEIERVACETVYGGSRKDWSFEENAHTRSQNTSLRAVREALWKRLPVGLALHADLGFTLVELMDEHLYVHVGSTEEEMKNFRSNPIPNRHASLHGFVTYSSRQNAYNALAMSAFMFETIMRMHRYLQENQKDDDQDDSPSSQS